MCYENYFTGRQINIRCILGIERENHFLNKKINLITNTTIRDKLIKVSNAENLKTMYMYVANDAILATDYIMFCVHIIGMGDAFGKYDFSWDTKFILPFKLIQLIFIVTLYKTRVNKLSISFNIL